MINKHTAVLEHLKKYHTITPLEALNAYGSMRLGAIIFDLRKEHKIDTEMIDVPTRFGSSRVAKYIYKGVNNEN